MEIENIKEKATTPWKEGATIEEIYESIAKYYKEIGLTEEQYREVWVINFPLMEDFQLENMVEMLFHTFK